MNKVRKTTFEDHIEIEKYTMGLSIVLCKLY